MSLPTCVTISGALLVLGCNDAASGPNETQALLARDRHWASLAAATSPNPDSVVAYWTDDARVVLPGQPVLTGKAAVRAMVTATTKIPGFHVTWTPDSAVVSRSGDLAYTYGVNEFTVPDSTGKLVTTRGRYLTVWRTDSRDQWRCVQDYSSPAPTSPAPSRQQ